MAKIYSAITLFFLIILFSPCLSHAASLSIEPGTGTVEVGKDISVKVSVKSDTPLNAISGLLSLPDNFAIESVSKSGSVLDFWVTQPLISKTANTVKFEGVKLGGFSGSSGTVVTINLKALKIGSAKILFRSGQILANDGQGTDITGDLIGGIFSVKPATENPAPVPVVVEPAPVPATEVPVAEEQPQPAPTLKAPEIMFGTKYGAPSIVGTSDYPNTQTLITFVALDGAKIFIQDTSDTEGSFNTLIPNSLKHGSYNVTAVMINKDDKTNSDVSNSIFINIGTPLSDIGFEIYVVFGVLILLILYLLGRVIFNANKEANDRRMKNQLNQVEDIIHKSFKLLRDEMKENEGKKMDGLKKDMNDAEKIITKKIDTID
jgi:hypothetical protein